MSRPRQVMLSAVALGLVMRLAFSLGYWTGKPLTHDEREYLLLAKNLASGRGFTYDGSGPGDVAPPPESSLAMPPERFGRAPLYPAFVALAAGRALRSASDLTEAPRSVKIAQSLIGAAGVWVIGLIAARAAGPAAGAVASLVAAIYPPLVWICAYALSEALYSGLALTSALLLGFAVNGREVGELDDSRRLWPVFLSGITTGAAALTKPAMLFFLVVAGPWLLLRKRLKLAAALVAGTVLVVAPWTVRNVRAYDRLVLVASEGGITFWTGNNPLARGEGDMAANPEIKRANVAIRERYPYLSPEELEPIYYRQGLAYIARHPLQWAALEGRKLFYLWVPIGPSYTLHSTRYVVVSLASYGVLLPFGLAGFVRLRRLASRPRALWLLAASAVLVCLVFFPQERFRIPVIDPALIVCAASWAALRRPAGS